MGWAMTSSTELVAPKCLCRLFLFCVCLVVFFFLAVIFKKQGTIVYTGNVGDCRAVLCRGGVAIDLTSDHRPSRDDERARIKGAGGEW